MQLRKTYDFVAAKVMELKIHKAFVRQPAAALAMGD